MKRRIVFLLVLATATALVGCKKGATVKGRVVHAFTEAPVAGAKVTVQFRRYDANRNWLDAGQVTLTSGANGEFSTDSSDMRCRFAVQATCDGFYPNEDCRLLRRLERRPTHMTHVLEVLLVPVQKPQNLARGQGEVQVHPTRRMGWNFAARRLVPEAQADIVGEPDELGREVAFLTACGQGGLRRVAGLSGPYALYNMHTAPTDGYEQRVDVRRIGEDERACYFVRTADGVHYAKIDVTGPVRAHQYMGLQFYWAYQPDGSTALEIPLDASIP